ncbi:MAG: AAA family ATPase [Acidobacteriota bacterium]|nr:AAA family ATPase [Acidobacteriota bacterium]
MLDDVALAALPDPVWDIEGVTQQGGLEVVFGPSDAGKSTLMAARACCLATGTTWLGIPVLRSGPVVVLVCEGLHAFKRKVRAWKALHDIAPSKPLGVHVIDSHVNFLDAVDVFRLVHVLNELHAIELIVDTLAQSIGADEENDSMQRAVTNAAMIRRTTGARVVFIHHSGKVRSRGARGGSALTAAADTVLSLDEERDGHVLRCVRQRDGARFAPVHLKLTPTADSVLFQRAEAPGASLVPEGARLQRQVIDWLRDHPGSTATTASENIKRRKADILSALLDLERAGRVSREKVGRANVWSVVDGLSRSVPVPVPVP